MPLDPRVQAYLNQMASLNAPPMHTLTPEQVRQGMQTDLEQPSEPELVAYVENRVIPGSAGDIPVRIYAPQGSGPFPVVVYFHGGGWVICNLDTHDGICRSLANEVGCLVVSVDYRQAPEHKFPAAVEDSYAAVQWVGENASKVNGDSSRIAVAGDSSGGNLAAVVAQIARDRGGPPLVFQLMICPVTDLRLNTPSMEAYGQGYDLTKLDMIWFINHYLNSEDEKKNPLASPLLASDLHGLPPALVITAEYDPIRDEGEKYGHRLKEAGVPVTVSRYNGMIHGFFGMPFDQSNALAEISSALQAAFTSKPPTTF
jgi:acetyl esterase